jgi:hypothetical protein
VRRIRPMAWLIEKSHISVSKCRQVLIAAELHRERRLGS